MTQPPPPHIHKHTQLVILGSHMVSGTRCPAGSDPVQMWSETDGCKEIHPCVLQDIGPLGPLPKKERRQSKRGREEKRQRGKEAKREGSKEKKQRGKEAKRKG